MFINVVLPDRLALSNTALSSNAPAYKILFIFKYIVVFYFKNQIKKIKIKYTNEALLIEHPAKFACLKSASRNKAPSKQAPCLDKKKIIN